MKVKTISSEQVWQSPDGKKTIWKTNLEGDDGQKYQLQTYSAEIAKEGFEGEVESYLDKRGQRFVKQPYQDGGYKGGGGANNAARAKADAAKQQEIRAEWAIGKAISSLGIFPLDDGALKQVEELAIKLNMMVDNVIGSTLAVKE